MNNSTGKYSLLLPLCCFIAIFGALTYWQEISDHIWQQDQRKQLNQLTVTYAIEIENKIKHTLSPKRLIEQHITKNQGQLDNIDSLVDDILLHHPSISQISFAPSNIISNVYPKTNNQHIIGRRVRPPNVEMQQPDDSKLKLSSFYSTPIKNNDGSVHFLINKPFYYQHKLWGYISFQINISEIIAQVQLPTIVTGAHSYQLSHVSGFHKLTILAQSTEPLSPNIYSAPVKVPENNWLLEISFNGASTNSLVSFGLFFRLLLSSSICLIIHLALLEPRRLRRHLSRASATLADKEVLLTSILNNCHDGILVCDSNGKIKIINGTARRLYNVKKDQQLTINASCFLSYQADDDQLSEPHENPLHQVLYRNEEQDQQIVITSDDGSTTTLKTHSRVLYDANKSPVGGMLFLQDITQLKQAKNTNTSRSIILDMLAHDKPIDSIFSHIIDDVEANFDHIQCAILLLDSQKKHLSEIVAPRLSPQLIKAIKTTEIGDRVMSSGSAIFHNKMIVVEDITTHPYWIDYKSLALQADIKSSWAQPIYSSTDEILGCFDIYSNQVNPASPPQILALKEAATLTALCIERHRDSQRLRKISLAVQHSPNSLIIIDAQGSIEYVNPKFCKITGYQPLELIGQPLDLITADVNNKVLYKEVWQSLKSGKDWRGELQSLKKNGDAYWAYDHVSAIKDQSGKIIKFVIVQEDITENRRHNEQLDYQQNHDLLTGLINNRAFNTQIQHAIELAKVDKKRHALCIIDLDNFKQVNQQCGQIAGDEFLRQTSTILRGHLRQRDTLARLNADQFALLMKDCSPEPAKRCCDELLTLLANHKFVWQDKSLSIHASIGITCIEQDSHSCEQMMKQADIACHLAKSSGGNQVTVYHHDNANNLPLHGDALFATAIRTGIDHDKFKLFVLPVIPTPTSKQQQCIEILLRLELESGEIVSPKAFLAAAQRYNLAKELDLWVIEHTMAWFNNNLSLLEQYDSIAINLTYSSFGDEAQLINIINLIEKNQHIANKITFEITEYTATSSLSRAYNFMHALKQYNVKFALDNYGSGYLSLAQVKNIPIDTINIDGHLINEIATNPVSKVLVESICRLAQAMAIKTVAKNVEDPALIPIINQLSIDAIQGFSQGRPIAIDALIEESAGVETQVI